MMGSKNMINSFCSGILTGIFMFAVIIVLSSNQKHPSKTFSKTYKQKLLDLENRLGMLEASVEERFIITGENFLYLEDKAMISENTEYHYRTISLLEKEKIKKSIVNE